MATPFFSVVIDNHNYGRFLRQAIESVLSQDFKDLELIVVDDGSTDGSREMLSSYGSRLRALLQQRQGQATAFNRGLSEARGELVCLLDSDDVFRPGKLSALAPLFDDPKVGGAEHWLEDADEGLSPVPQHFPAWPPRYRLEDFLEARTEFTATSGLCFRRKALERALPIPADLFYYLDDFLTVRVLLDAEIANLPKPLGVHRLHGCNWCAGGYEDPVKLDKDFKNREIFLRHMESWLADRGVKTSPRFAQKQSLEILRRKVLREALRAEPGRAWDLWWEGWKAAPGGRFALFRMITLALAVISPSLYLSFYSGYSSWGGLKRLRLRLFPENGGGATVSN
ncbi:MAG: glycosyltransferase family 2 protein [Elusimicrobia bacterium]|nr:glycosyltransferase family 2 protein [Elusimicrobiota bacterium]